MSIADQIKRNKKKNYYLFSYLLAIDLIIKFYLIQARNNLF